MCIIYILSWFIFSITDILILLFRVTSHYEANNQSTVPILVKAFLYNQQLSKLSQFVTT